MTLTCFNFQLLTDKLSNSYRRAKYQLMKEIQLIEIKFFILINEESADLFPESTVKKALMPEFFDDPVRPKKSRTMCQSDKEKLENIAPDFLSIKI